MLRPTGGDLLRGVHTQLHDSVLPELEPGAAERQLKAALHVLRRLERCWDRMPAYLAADNADLADTLERIAGMLGSAAAAAAEAVPATAGPEASPGEVNERLQALVAETDARVRADTAMDRALRASVLAVLTELYRRMLDREGQAWATS